MVKFEKTSNSFLHVFKFFITIYFVENTCGKDYSWQKQKTHNKCDFPLTKTNGQNIFSYDIIKTRVLKMRKVSKMI